MRLFNFFKPQRYDMDSIEGINSIPVPAKNYTTGDPTKDCIYYLLQRKATEHKKNGRMDLAIACLRKSNELSDYETKPLLLEKEYLRLVKYILQTGDISLAEKKEEYIYKRHPEFKDRRISNLSRIKECIKKNKEWKNDLVIVHTNHSCPICGKYNNKIYSISGKDRSYPKLPPEIIQIGGFCKTCHLGMTSYFEDISTKPN